MVIYIIHLNELTVTPQGPVQRPTLFNSIFSSTGTLSKSDYGAQLCGVANMLERKDPIQRELERIKHDA